MKKNDYVEKFHVENGKLYFENEIIGKDEKTPGFTQYYFEKDYLGAGANGITYKVKHRILDIYQVVKIYFPEEGKNVIDKAKEEAKKNAKFYLAGTIAVVFDAGEFDYPVKIAYSVMESVQGFYTFKQLKIDLKTRFKVSNNGCLDIMNRDHRCYMNKVLSICAGFLASVMELYQKDTTHGDLNPGNILWIPKEGTIEDISVYRNDVLGELKVDTVKLIDLGSSVFSGNRDLGKARDSMYIYENVRTLLTPFFVNKKTSFKDCMNFQNVNVLFKDFELNNKFLPGVKSQNSFKVISPGVLAADLYRMVCVMTIALGFIHANSQLECDDARMLYRLMYDNGKMDFCDNLSLKGNEVLEKMNQIGSSGKCINWDSFWNSSLFKKLNIDKIKTIRECRLEEIIK